MIAPKTDLAVQYDAMATPLLHVHCMNQSCFAQILTESVGDPAFIVYIF